MSFVRRGLLILGSGILLVTALLWTQQERLLFYPQALPADFAFHFSSPSTQQQLVCGTQPILHFLTFPGQSHQSLFLYFHGNGGALDSWGEVGAELTRFSGSEVWMLDYPGYGKSAGSISSEQQLLEMADCWYQKAQETHPETQIILFGRSIGSGLAVRLAATHHPKALILEAPYLSLKSLAQIHFPWVPQVLIRYNLPSEIWIPDVAAPTLILHGSNDELIPFVQGQALSKIAKQATLVEIPGGHHNDLGHFPLYWQRLGTWLQSIGN